ncbi:hypothetical protein CLV74_104308 [Donghicola tyrosinivorans]|uniref:Uncharacterized protein n=1 Tax=Donghicola tyrosinivorans TaxID=1652492 RepID=A0A2T0WX60_9RHOB|nr:hypothetical protein CLV74_104308 [Donghicola tyrosinivorans]
MGALPPAGFARAPRGIFAKMKRPLETGVFFVLCKEEEDLGGMRCRCLTGLGGQSKAASYV